MEERRRYSCNYNLIFRVTMMIIICCGGKIHEDFRPCILMFIPLIRILFQRLDIFNCIDLVRANAFQAITVVGRCGTLVHEDLN